MEYWIYESMYGYMVVVYISLVRSTEYTVQPFNQSTNQSSIYQLVNVSINCSIVFIIYAQDII